MKELNDDQIQFLLDSKRGIDIPELKNREIESYRNYEQLFTILSEKPLPNIPQGFSAKVVRRIESGKNSFATILSCSLIGILVLLGIGLIVNVELFEGLQLLVLKSKVIILWALFLFICIHYLDIKLIKRF